MPVMKDYKCDKHGYFEGFEAKCPMKDCHEEVYVVFLQAPGIISDKTKKNDKTVKQLAMDFGMTDVKSTREGDNQAGYYTRNNQTPPAEAPRQPRPGDAAIWGGSNRFSMQNLLSGNAVRPVADENVSFSPKEAGNLTGPRAASYISDHENLKIKE